VVLIKYIGPNGKVIDKTVPVLNAIKLGDIKPGTKYLIVPKGGTIIAFQPAPVPPAAKKPPLGVQPPKTEPIPVVKARPQPPKPIPAPVAKIEQEKIAAAQVVKVKAAAVQAAQAKMTAAQQKVARLEKQAAALNQFATAKGNAVERTAFRVSRANAAAARAEAQAQVAIAKVALAQAEAARMTAIAKVQRAQANLARVEAGIAVRERAFAVKFRNARVAALKAAKAQFIQAKAFVNKAVQELRAAQQIEKQKVTAAKKTVALKNVKQPPKH
jgi:hypothetical protein